MKITIHQPQYMPWIGYYHKMASADLFVFLDDVQFKKNEWQHRNRIRTSQGWQWLSVPNSYTYPQRITEVQVQNNEHWQQKHLKSLQVAYGRSAFYKNYNDIFESFFSKSWTTIDTVCIESVQLLATSIGITTPTVISSQYGFSGVSTERLVNICKYFNADTYLAGIGGKGYLDEDAFHHVGITVEYQHFSCPFYSQLWSKGADDFIPNLSAIDLVLNCGPDAMQILMEEYELSHSSF